MNVKLNKMNTISLSREDLESYASKSLAFHALDISRISSTLIAQIYKFEKSRVLNIFSILDEIKYLEGLKKSTSTGKESQFRGAILKGLNKKHFMDASFINKNIGNHLGYDNGKSKKLDKIIKEAFKRNTSGYADDEFFCYIAHHCTIGAYEDRAKKSLTGEWIIFKSYKGQNYYLTLAAHNENDCDILNRVNDVYEFDYEFLRENA